MIYSLVTYNSDKTIDEIIEFSSVTEFSETLSANVLSNPVENNYPISDSLTMNQTSFTINGVVSAYSSKEREIVLDGDKFKLVENTDQTTTAEVDLEKRFKMLMEDKRVFSIYRSKSIFDIEVTFLEKFENCVIERLNFTARSGISGAIFPQLTIRQIRIANVVVEDNVNAVPKLQPKLAPKGKNSGTSTASGEGADKDGDGVVSDEEKAADAVNKETKPYSVFTPAIKTARAEADDVTSRANAWAEATRLQDSTGRAYTIQRISGVWQAVPMSKPKG